MTSQGDSRVDISLRRVIDSLPLSIFWKDSNSRYLGCNEFFARAAGLADPRAVTGLSDCDMPWADNAERFRQQDRQILETGEPWRAYDEAAATPDGTRVFLRTAKVPLRDAEGKVVGIVGAAEWINHTDLAPMDMPDPEERLRALTESAAEAVVVIQDGRIMYVNARGREIFGGTGEDLLGLPVERVVHPSDRRRVLNDFEQVLSGNEPAFASLYELRVFNREGRVRWIQASTTLMPWKGRAATLHFIIDVTPSRRQKEIQDALNRASTVMAGPLVPEDVFAAVARELATAGFLMHVFTLNPDGTLSLSFLGKEPEVARELEKLFGVPCDSPFPFREGGEFDQVISGRETLLITDVGAMLESIFPPELRAAIPSLVKAIGVKRMILAPLADESSVVGMIALENPDETEGDLPAVTAFALQMGSALQRARLAKAMARENAERRHAQAERAMLFAAIEQAAEYVLITDVNGTITYANPAFERVTGYSREEAIGKSPRILKSGRQDSAFYESMWKVLTSGNVWRGHIVNRRKDGSTYREEASISPVKTDGNRIVSYVAVKRDVTEATELEARLHAAQKMEAVGRLAGGVAHDFNNILTTITGYADLLLTGMGDQDPRVHEVREILAASRRGSGLTRQLLIFCRKQVITPSLVSLNAVIEDLHAMLRPLIGEDIQLEYELAHELWPVLADAGQLEQVILNLSVNARDAMPSGGTLVFRTDNLRRDGSPARAREQVVLSIRDTGIGMSEEVRSHLFEPFFTTKKAGSGTGLGLATVYGIVNQSQGHIEVVSEQGKGTEFRISFPRAPGSVFRDEEDGKGSEVPRGRETILVVEDEQAVRSLTCTLLRSWGYSVLEAALPSEALTIAEREGDSIQLLLTDVVMPGMRGSELARRVLPQCRSAVVLFMSGYPDDEGLGLESRGPRVHFLAKPFTPEALARKVRETLDGA
jgi:PAS domain S-box-containing protein